LLADRIKTRTKPNDVDERIAYYGLRILAHRLNGNDDELLVDLTELEKTIGESDDEKPDAAGDVDAVLLPFANGFGEEYQDGYGNVQIAIDQLRAQLGKQNPVEQFLGKLDGVETSWEVEVAVPDLVNLVEPKRAAELLLKALQTPNVELSFDPQHVETIELARELALENIESLPTAPWALCHSTETETLFQRLLEEFSQRPVSPNERQDYREDYTYRQAVAYYFRGLVFRGRDDIASRLFVEQSSSRSRYGGDLFGDWKPRQASREQRDAMYHFLLKLVESHPELDVWEQAIGLAMSTGKSADLRQLIDQTLARDDLLAGTRLTLQKTRATMLLAVGDVDAAVAQFRDLIAEMRTQPGEETNNDIGTIAMRITTIGRLLKNQALVDEGMDIVEPLYAASVANYPRGDVDPSYRASVSIFDVYSSVLIERGKFARVEQLLVNMIANSASQTRGYSFGGPDAPGVQLAELYLNHGRFADVVTLLDQGTWWTSDDLTTDLGMSHGRSLALIAARAFAETDRVDIAKSIAERLVAENLGNDDAWNLLFTLAGDAFPAIAQRMFQRDQFEERPLIWLARYQLDHDMTAEAEVTIRRAIAIDPSDGEQGRGDRMRAYSVLADVLRAKGEAQEQLFRGAVRAIRMSEEADRYLSVGLISHALALYNESLEQFADAYCIQSRLAIQLASQGDFERAAVHYQRAFELMPDSFGRVESHCFGCEGAFDGELASTIAERVFRRLAEERPNDAKVRYLSGYLHESEGRYQEALQDYLQATTLDPDYVNAWVKIYGLRENIPLPTNVSDDAEINVYRLAPLRQSLSRGLYSVNNLRRLWDAAAEVEARIPKIESKPIYPLKAAAETRKSDNGMSSPYAMYVHDSSVHDVPASPNKLLSENESIAYLSRIMEAARQ